MGEDIPMADSHPENTDSLSRMDPHAEFDPLFRLERNRTSTHNADFLCCGGPSHNFLGCLCHCHDFQDYGRAAMQRGCVHMDLFADV